MQNRVKNFDLHQNKKTYLNDINFTWSEEFEDYLRNIAKYSEGTIEKTFTILITVLNYYYKKRDELQLEMNDKFREKGFKKGKKSVNKANPLTDEQLLALKNYKFKEKHLQLMQDRFIWQCYTGIRYIDAFRITKNDIKDGWLRFMPSKTERHKVLVEQPLHEVAISLLEKYEYDMTRLKIANQPYNRGLRDMFTKLNDDKELKLNEQEPNEEESKSKYDVNFGSYASRDTFISRAVQAGIDWKTILEWVGQSSYAIMNRYIKTEDKWKKEQMKKIS
jgi:integrase